MGQIVWINQYPAEETFPYDKRIRLLRERGAACGHDLGAVIRVTGHHRIPLGSFDA